MPFCDWHRYILQNNIIISRDCFFKHIHSFSVTLIADIEYEQFMCSITITEMRILNLVSREETNDNTSMNDMVEILQMHAKMYPKMQPQDCFKLIYQADFAGGHILGDEGIALRYFEQKYAETPANENEELAVEIGNHLCRINIAKAKTLYPAAQIFDWFCRTAETHRGSMAEFSADMKTLKKHISLFSFTQEEFDAYASWYGSEGYPSVHPSSVYQEAYNPHYRVIYTGLWKAADIED